MEENKKKKLTPEEKEKKDVAWENMMLKYLVPTVGLAGFIIGLIGFISTVTENAGAAVFFMILTLLGAGGIAYGVLLLVKKILGKNKKTIVQPDGSVNE